MLTDVLIHLDQPLGEVTAGEVASALRLLPGVGEVRFESHAARFLQLWYDPSQVTAGRLLDTVKAMGKNGRLVAI